MIWRCVRLASTCSPSNAADVSVQDLIRPAAQTELERGDVLLVDVLDPGVEIAKLCEKYALEAMPLDQDTTYFTDRSQESGWSR